VGHDPAEAMGDHPGVAERAGEVPLEDLGGQLVAVAGANRLEPVGEVAEVALRPRLAEAGVLGLEAAGRLAPRVLGHNGFAAVVDDESASFADQGHADGHSPPDKAAWGVHVLEPGGFLGLVLL